LKHEDLKQNDIVIFKRYCDILEREDFQDGSVIAVYPEIQKVAISWLEGYKSRVDEVEYIKVIAKYDPNGKSMKFGVFSGNSVLLES
jgi:hypothetical protein